MSPYHPDLALRTLALEYDGLFRLLAAHRQDYRPPAPRRHPFVVLRDALGRWPMPRRRPTVDLRPVLHH
jgi:hypothetical protein